MVIPKIDMETKWKKKKQSPLWGGGGWSVSVKKQTFMSCTQMSTRNIWKFGFCFYLCHEHYSNRAMQIVSTREFRANQKKYFELAEHETVFVSRKNDVPLSLALPMMTTFFQKKNSYLFRKGWRTSKTEEQQRLKTSTIYGKVFCRIGWDIKRGFAENP